MAHFRTREESIENLLDLVETERGEQATHLQLLVAGRLLADEVRRLRGEVQFVLDDNERMLQQHADEVVALDRVRALVESDRDVDGNLGIQPRWSATELERVLEGRK